MTSKQMGNYEVVSDTRTPEASLRLLRVGPGISIDPHYHRKTRQLYVVLSGAIEIHLGRGRLDARPFDAVQIPARTVHGVLASAPSLVLSISIPPLAMEDQIPVRGSEEPSYGGE